MWNARAIRHPMRMQSHQEAHIITVTTSLRYVVSILIIILLPPHAIDQMS